MLSERQFAGCDWLWEKGLYALTSKSTKQVEVMQAKEWANNYLMKILSWLALN